MSAKTTTTTNGSLVKEENLDRPFQFETMMKELNEPERVTFTCQQLDDEDNSNETDLSLNQNQNNSKNSSYKLPVNQYQNMHHANSLPSIDSLIGQQQHQHQTTTATTTNNQQQQQHIEMDWNDTEFLKLFESDHLFNANGQNNQNQSNNIVYSNQNQSFLKQNADNLAFNDDSNVLNFDLNHQRIDHNNQYTMNNNNNANGTNIIDSSLKTCIFI